MIPPAISDALAGRKRILLAGAGGGYDILGAVPLLAELLATGDREVHLASLSFTYLNGLTGAVQQRRFPNLYEVPASVYSPHFDIAVRIQACDERRFDSRPDERVQTKAASTAATAAIAPGLLTPPAPLADVPRRRSVFLAGSIEMGLAENWQSAVALALADEDVCILNPRREDWDACWRQRWMSRASSSRLSGSWRRKSAQR